MSIERLLDAVECRGDIGRRVAAHGPRPWISRLCSFQIRWATGSPLLCRCPARNLGFAATGVAARCARAASGHAAAAPPSVAKNFRRAM